jgi:hypothetical protein
MLRNTEFQKEIMERMVLLSTTWGSRDNYHCILEKKEENQLL